MNPQAQKQFDTLEGIKNELIKIRDSEAYKNVKPGSDVAKGLAGTFQGVGGVLSNMEVKNGVLTSKSARKAVENGQQNVPTNINPMVKLQQEYSKLNSALTQEKATRTALEADVSIADKRLQQQKDGIAVPTPTGTPAPKATDTPAGGNTSLTVGGLDALTTTSDGTVDPVAQAMATHMAETTANVNNQLEALNKMVELEDDDTKALVQNINSSAQLAIQRMERENVRITQATQVAGIVSGRGQYSMYEHEGIISEVIQEGLDRITDIENTRTKAVIETKKAFREFRYKAFVQGSEMVQALADAKMETISAIATRLQEVETAQREKVRFDQEQADRSALILAPELVGMSNEEITKTAYANGIEPGALLRAVNDAKFEQDDRALTLEGKEVGIEADKESILTQKHNRYLAQIKSDRETAEADVGKPLPPLTTTEIKDFKELTGVSAPPQWTRQDITNFLDTYPDAPANEVPNLIKKYNAAVDFMNKNADKEGTDEEVTEEDLINHLESNVESTDARRSKVTEMLLSGQGWFGKDSIAGKASDKPWSLQDDSSMWKLGTIDAKNWLKKPDTQKRIDELLEEGYEAYEITQILADESGASKR